MAFASIVVLGYLLGSCPWGVWVVKLFRHEDIRHQGSGNIGLTNVMRVHGRRVGAPVAILDVAKGFVPALLGMLLVSHTCGAVAGAAAMVGHWRPLFLRFARGGKMVATGGGAFFALAPYVALSGLGLWLSIFLLWGWASVASLIVAAFMPVGVRLFGYPRPVFFFACFLLVGVVLLHRKNLSRLRRGQENRSPVALVPRLRAALS